MSDPSVADLLARRLAVLAILDRRVSAAIGATKRALAQMLTPGDAKKPTHPDDPTLQLGRVVFTIRKRQAAVTDLDALTAWASEHYPHRVVELDWEPVNLTQWREYREAYPGDRRAVTELDPAFVAEVRSTSASAGEPCYQGELDVPGVTVFQPDPVLSVTPAKDVPDHAWRSLVAETARELTDDAAAQED